ncbi:MAG: 6-phosphofructokinase [Sulfuricurvum sp.]
MNSIAILCSGGDVSGMNPAIKHFVEYALAKDLKPYLIYDGYDGLIDGDIHEAYFSSVSGIINRGGTILRSKRSSRFLDPSYRAKAKANLAKLGIDKLVVLGGDGSFRGMSAFCAEHNISFCGVPSTIDNDIVGTEYSLGVDTALNVIRSAIDNIRDTASSFSRAFVIETMGRDCGYLALISALTSGAELCLIPEVEYDLIHYKQKFAQELKNGRRYFIAVVSEGIKDSSQSIAKWFEDEVGIEARVTTLGHTQRGGSPTTYDRLMAYRFVTHAIDALLSKDGANSVICYNSGGFNYKDIETIAKSKFELSSELLGYLRYV